ncbi:hypothetical protein CX016_004406 [Salmonella enterica subsp. enterica serovar Javiana]|nr:hypothetical protein [Salmonella enterica subsp. enterica serovar Javiana]
MFHTIVSIKNDGHYFCRAGGNRPDGLNEPVTLLRKNEEEKIRQSELNIIMNFIDEQQLTNSDIPKKSTVPNEDKKGIR